MAIDSFIFGGDTGNTPDSLNKKREYAMRLMMGQGAPKNVGEGLNALGNAIIARTMMDEAAASEKGIAETWKKLLQEGQSIGAFGGTPSGGASSGSDKPAGLASAEPFKTNDPVAMDIPVEGRAFLNAVAGGESGGKYNIRYTPQGGATFDGFDKHPGIMEPGPHGPSSAAGRYQFTRTTWDSLPAEVKGDGKFTPENQDRAAWFLAQRDFKARTGRDLMQVMQTDGLQPETLQTLAPTWQAFKVNPNRHIATYNDSLTRYRTAGGGAPGQAPGAVSAAAPPQMASQGDGIMTDAEIDQQFPPQVAPTVKAEAAKLRAGLADGSIKPAARQMAARSVNDASPVASQWGMQAQDGTPLPPRRPNELIPPEMRQPQAQAPAQPAPVQVAQAAPQAPQQPMAIQPQQQAAQAPSQNQNLQAQAAWWEKIIASPATPPQMRELAKLRYQALREEQNSIRQRSWQQEDRAQQNAREDAKTAQQRGWTVGDRQQQWQREDTKEAAKANDPVARKKTELEIKALENKVNDSPANSVEERKAAAAKAGMKEDSPGYQAFILTGKMPREDAQPLSSTDKKAIMEAEDAALSNKTVITSLQDAKKLSPQAHTGAGASFRAKIGNMLPDGLVPDAIASKRSSEATAEYENLVLGQALGQLKATFGAAPTEGERKILMELQASVNQPDSVRQKILDRAIAMAETRLRFNEQRASELRGGDYYKPADKRGQPAQPAQSGKPLADPLGIR